MKFKQVVYCSVHQAPVVQRLDNAIHWISVNKTNHTICWIVIYPGDRVIHLSNNWGQNCSNTEDGFQLASISCLVNCMLKCDVDHTWGHTSAPLIYECFHGHEVKFRHNPESAPKFTADPRSTEFLIRSMYGKNRSENPFTPLLKVGSKCAYQIILTSSSVKPSIFS